MNAQHEDFIGIYENVYPEGYCQHLIDEFERLTHSGVGMNRQQSEGALRHRKNDLQIGLNFGVHAVRDFADRGITEIFFSGIQQCYEHYVGQFSVLSDGNVRGTHMKMQRTDPGGGYHVWHGEQGGGDLANRVLVYTLYLNTFDPEEGGETEFLYQRKRIRPKANTVLLWPAAFTHAHRGNVVLGERSKYIVTGWFYYE